MLDRLLSLDWSMQTVYVLCAALGGLVLVVQTILLVFGLGDSDLDADVDADFDVDSGEGSFGVLSVKAITAFVTFFGLSGWWALSAGLGQLLSVVVAVSSGGVVMLLVAVLLHLQTKLQSKGNIDPGKAVGKTATVYLRIPGNRSGTGKITVSLQGRSVEYPAVTAGAEIPTGGSVRIESMPTAGTFEVVPLNQE